MLAKKKIDKKNSGEFSDLLRIINFSENFQRIFREKRTFLACKCKINWLGFMLVKKVLKITLLLNMKFEKVLKRRDN